MGMTAVVDADGRVAGIFTDGDLRRALERVRDVARGAGRRRDDAHAAHDRPERLAVDCVEMMETPPKVSAAARRRRRAARLVGALHMHDLFRARVV